MRRSAAPPVTSILCPIDFSPHSRAALAYAASIARHTGAPLTVLFVNDPLLVSVAAMELGERTVAERSATELRQFIRKTIKPAGPIEIRAEQAIGQPATEILNLARRRACDLIVIGTEGRSGLRKLFFGSTTHEVIRHTTVPVAIVALRQAGTRRPAAQWPARRILAPVDLGRHTDHDARAAAAIARPSGAVLTLVHVVTPVQAPPWHAADAPMIERLRIARARRRLETLAATLQPRAGIQVIFGSPAEGIARTVRSTRSDLVVMPLRGGDGLLQPRPGSIAYKVLCEARVPVLVLPAGRATRHG